MELVLTQDEISEATSVGCERRRVSVGRLHDRMHAPGVDPLKIDVLGALGEKAYAKAMGIVWNKGVNTFKDPDVGLVQVRSTDDENGRLIIRPSDSNSETYVLVVCASPKFKIVGQIRGKDGKQDRWVRDYNGRPPAWFVPQLYLQPISFPVLGIDIFSEIPEIKEV